jgi:mRNA interferase MazF
MPTFRAGDVVRVPFPYTNRETTQRRPALVISDGAIGSGMLLWVLMITSAGNRSWPGDVALADDANATGLPAPSVVRTFKIATIEAAAAERIGTVATEVLATVRTEVGQLLGLSTNRGTTP